MIRLTAYLPNPQVRRAIQMLLMTGLRRGELIGLFWQDIDFDRKELLVRRTVSRFDRKTIVSTPKTSSSERRIPLSDGVLALLLEQKKYVAFLKNSEGSGWNDTAKFYTHMFADSQKITAEVIENVFK